MAQKEQRISAKVTMSEANPAEFAEMGKKQVEAMMDLQKEFMEAVGEVNRGWGARVKAEAEFATEFAGKLTAAKSVPETTAICQEWMSRRMEMFSEDIKRFVADLQKFTATAARLLPRPVTGGST